MQKSLTSFFSSVLGLLMPPRETDRVVRDISVHDLFAIATPEGPLPYHDPSVIALVWELKYRRNKKAAALAGEYLSELLLTEASESTGKPLLIPMPMHAARRKERGYNQTELLCEAAMKFVKDSFEYAPGVLERVKHTSPQQGLARHARLANVKNSMQITNPALVRGRVCIVLDDVLTTGSTCAEARRALHAAGCSAVQIIVLSQS